LFLEAACKSGIEQNLIDWFYQLIDKRVRDILLALLITKLPHLKTLFMATPEGETGVLKILADLGAENTPRVLENFNIIYVYSVFHIRVSNHISP
jgi:hypothetical protein